MKRSFKIFIAFFVLLFTLLFTAPLLFKKSIQETISKEIDAMFKADFSMEGISISFISSFPNTSINLKEILVVNHKPFMGDTLLTVKEIHLETSIKNLLSKKLRIDLFKITDAKLNLRTNKDNISNYDIVKKANNIRKDDPNPSSNNYGISLHIEKYSLNNIQFQYHDTKNNTLLEIKNLNHRGTGVFSSKNVFLETYSSFETLNLVSNNVKLIDDISFLYDAKLAVNLDNSKIEFKENLAQLNDLKFSFHGFIKPVNKGINVDINFESKESSFKSLLSLVPKAYSSDFENIIAKGVLQFNGNAKGLYSENTIPKFNIDLNTNNASFHYPNFKKEISNIYLNTNIQNKTGKINDTKIALKRFDATIDEDSFEASGYISDLITNPSVKAKLKGSINLENLGNAYPIETEADLEGIISFDISSQFTQKELEKELYEEIKNSGRISIKQLSVKTEMLPNTIIIDEAMLNFKPNIFLLEKFFARTGKSDLNAEGRLTNLVGFVLGTKALMGNFSVKSNNIDVFDFLSEDEVSINKPDKNIDSTLISEIKIPKNLCITTKLFANKVNYDNIILSNLTGEINIKDQEAIFKNTNANLLEGTIILNGNLNTKPTPSVFDFSMSLKELDIEKSFSTLELFSSISPFAKAFQGKMSTSLNLKGLLDTAFFPVMKSLTGDGISKLQLKEVDTKQSNALSLLEQNLNFIDFDKLDMKKIQTSIKFENSTISFKPFQIATYDGVAIEVQGSHSFENSMNYRLSTKVPVGYLGKETGNLLSGLPKEELKALKVPIQIKLSGAMSNPNITPDYSAALKIISQKVIESQKNKLLNSLRKNTTKEVNPKDKKENSIEETARNILKGFF